MIVNLRPGDLGLLDCIVEECDERFSAEEQEGILKVVGDVLGRVDEVEEEEGMNGADAMSGAQEEVNGG